MNILSCITNIADSNDFASVDSLFQCLFMSPGARFFFHFS